MSERLGPDEIATQIELRKTRLTAVIADLKAVLVEDIPSFFTRQGKHAFLSNPVKAGAMPDGDIKALKAGLVEGGRQAAAKLEDELGESSLWFESSSLVNDNKTLVDCEGVWSKVRGVESTLQSVLQEYGLAGADAPVYKAPLYFVSGRYFPALAEHFWRLIEELQALEQEKGEAEANDLRSGLSSKWDDA